MDVDKGSMYFIEDHTEERTVRSIFEDYDYQSNTVGSITGLVSFSREDIVKSYCLNKRKDRRSLT